MAATRFTVPFVVAVLIGSFALSGCREEARDPRQQPPLVRITQVEVAAQAYRSFTGVVSARVQSDLGFRVPGKVVARLVDRGQAVNRGQPLMRIDTADLELASVAREGIVKAAQARAAQTASDERRFRGLVAQGAISALAYEQSQSAAAAAAADLRTAEAQASVARNARSYSLLSADVDGIVVDTLAEPGQVVAAGQAVIRLAHAGPREATVDLPETLRPLLGSTAIAQPYATQDALSPATLRQLAQAADPVSRTYEARYVLEGAAAEAPLGSTVTIRIPDTRRETRFQIPLSALADNGSGTGVWVIESSSPNEATTVWRPVTVVALGAETASVAMGLNQGDRFVAMGAHLLQPGERVRIGDKDYEASTSQEIAQ